ncbi:cell envelope integrity protein TolA [Ideonella livida]|uniref:Cell envelope integrity protein TolA n=1 Tax=Ideonella livida TaxID=2707176 RepID=A0A7C9PIG2_9BURK|nr:cell envelope integrity protein TolA [Ideonella livida]NDY92628.1 cell envelope integrity protein TolA [Ideonella livida]
MAKTCIVHVGMHKTGTSSIQQTLFRNASLQGLHYVDLDTPNASYPMLLAFAERLEGLPYYGRLGTPLSELEVLRQRMRDTLVKELSKPFERFLISGEEISKMSETEVRAMADLLRSCVDEVRVVAYVRDVKGYMESALQQRLKGGSLDLGRRMRVLYPDYRDRFQKFETVFGPDRVSLWPFRPDAFPERCVVRDLAARLDFRLDLGTIVRSNESMSAEAAALLYLVRKWLPPLPKGQDSLAGERKLVRAISHLPGRKLRLAPQTVLETATPQADDLAWIAARVGQELLLPGVAGEGDLRDEEDLVALARSCVPWLAGQLGEPLATDMSVEDLAWCLARLRNLHCPQALTTRDALQAHLQQQELDRLQRRQARKARQAALQTPVRRGGRRKAVEAAGVPATPEPPAAPGERVSELLQQLRADFAKPPRTPAEERAARQAEREHKQALRAQREASRAGRQALRDVRKAERKAQRQTSPAGDDAGGA